MIVNNIDFPNYDDLKPIDNAMVGTVMQKINDSLDNIDVSIPNKIEGINLLRSLRKSKYHYFIDFFGAIRKKFMKYCLNFNQNQRIQLISLKFIQEFFTEEGPNSIHKEIISSLTIELFKLLKSDINNLKEAAKICIQTMARNVVSTTKFVSLIKEMKNSDQETNAFIYECIREGLIQIKGTFHLNCPMEEILEELDIKDILNESSTNEEYIGKIIHIFHLIKQTLDPIEEKEVFNSLNDEDKEIYLKLSS